jgi:spore coat protein U-like protein
MSKKFALPFVALALLAIALTSADAVAATASASFNVSVTVQSACSVSATSMRFGTYNGAATNATSSISVQCTHSTPYNVGLSEGLAPGARVANRMMIGPNSSLLGYSLRSNTGGSVNWGHTVGVDTVAGTGSGSVQTLSVLGQIPAGQSVQNGPYADTITVTVTY